MMVRPLNDYEIQYNREHGAEVESSRMAKKVLERRQRVLIEEFAKGKATQEDMDNNDPLIVSENVMERAIRLSRYYLNHAQAAYSVLPDNAVAAPGEKILNVIRDKKLEGFDRRDMMRSCRAFKTVAEIQPVLDSLEDYGYIARQPEKPSVTGRPPLPKYLVNPKVHEMIQGRQEDSKRTVH